MFNCTYSITMHRQKLRWFTQKWANVSRTWLIRMQHRTQQTTH